MKSLLFLQKALALSFLSGLLLLVSGCGSLYKVNQQVEPNINQVRLHIGMGRYLVVHQNFGAWQLANANIIGDTLIGLTQPLPPDRYAFMRTKVDGYTRFNRNETEILDESHFYLRDTVFPEIESSNVKIPATSIHHIDMYEYAAGRTITSNLAAVAIPLVAVYGIGALVSCPYVYTYGSDGYILTGEMYGGAIYPALERHDYMQLPESAVFKDQVKLKISNELKESQHTNLAQLLVVSHPAGSQAYADKNGKILTTSDEMPPVTAITTGGFDFTDQVKSKDLDCFMLNEANSRSSVNELILSFNIPNHIINGARNTLTPNLGTSNNQNSNSETSNTVTANNITLNTAKLVVNAKNSLWADHAYNEFYGLMGNYFTKWTAQQKELDRQKLIRQMLDQDTPLSVYLETESGWKFLDYYDFTGPVAPRDMILQIDLSQAKIIHTETAHTITTNSESINTDRSSLNAIRLKLVSGFMFWELDYAAIDFSENLPVSTKIIKATTAIDEKGTDVLASLTHDDDHYLVQPDIGNEVIISFDFISTDNTTPELYGPEMTSPEINVKNTLFLHSKGYYEKNAEYTGNPEWLKLMALKHKHSFSEFSYDQYMDFLKESGYVTAEP